MMKRSHKKVIHLIAAARPNFMKIAPLYHALSRVRWAQPVIVHTGQHYDINMSDAFFLDLSLPKPQVHLGVGSGTHSEQTGRVMMAYEKLLISDRPDLVVVVGDVNSTVAASLAAVKLGVKVAHLEAGLRSFDRTMPEEINRIVTDSIADLLWTPSVDGDENLLKEGIGSEKIERVGNIMIDSLEMLRPIIEKEDAVRKYNLQNGSYGLVTLHRPSNVDSLPLLKKLLNGLVRISEKVPLIFPVHPRTWKNLKDNNLISAVNGHKNLHLEEPLSYIPFMSLVFNCKLVITDSGGLQEETTYLGTPCLTLRANTERPITIRQGTNRLCNCKNLEGYVDEILDNSNAKTKVPDMWDGHTAHRVVESIRRFIK
jgi:UDP-N-acetylglucosamine 2-epimerase (non-hydrolysing)